MRDRVLALSFDPALETFDDRSLREFLTARNIDAILRHFFVADDAQPRFLHSACPVHSCRTSCQ